MSKPNPTPEYLRECFRYDESTGKLWWKRRPKSHFKDDASHARSSKKTGRKRAGSIDASNGYRRVVLDGRCYREHLVVWAIATGEWPIDDIDHINHVRDDNRISNLRVAGKRHNSKNQSLYKSNKSGVSGVYWHHGAWKARIRPDGKTVYLGTFRTIEQATAAIEDARSANLFHTNHGKKRISA